MAHQYVTMLYVAYMCWTRNRLFFSKAEHYAQIMSEFLGLFAVLVLQESLVIDRHNKA